jgi:hypothetical protein
VRGAPTPAASGTRRSLCRSLCWPVPSAPCDRARMARRCVASARHAARCTVHAATRQAVWLHDAPCHAACGNIQRPRRCAATAGCRQPIGKPDDAAPTNNNKQTAAATTGKEDSGSGQRMPTERANGARRRSTPTEHADGARRRSTPAEHADGARRRDLDARSAGSSPSSAAYCTLHCSTSCRPRWRASGVCARTHALTLVRACLRARMQAEPMHGHCGCAVHEPSVVRSRK